MKESQFVKENIEDWKELEKLLDSADTNPDRLQSLFVKVSGDLSYARTYFPRRAVRNYLNTLLNPVFDSLRTNKKSSFWKRIYSFYSHTLPSEIITNRNAFIASFLVFAIAVAIGVFSSFQDDSFLRQILGDSYVEMTDENIRNNDPMAVYKGEDKAGMFLGITINNIQVAFFTFVLGILASVGTFFLLFKNGIMLGAFQAYFYQKGLFMTSFLTIWIHGTIEISSIIIAGAAGIILGNGLLFPGTFSRGVAIRESAVRALVILLSTIPLFVIAGFLEGFVTRHTELPDFVKVGIILASLTFIVFLYIVHPYRFYKSGRYKKNQVYIDNENSSSNIVLHAVSEKASVEMRSKFRLVIVSLVLPSMLVFLSIIYMMIESNKFYLIDNLNIGIFDKPSFLTPLVFAILVIVGMFFFTKLSMIFNADNYSWKETLKYLIKTPVPSFLLSAMIILSLFWLPLWVLLLSFFILPYPAFAKVMKDMIVLKDYKYVLMFKTISDYYRYWFRFSIGTFVLVALLGLIGFVAQSSVGFVLKEYLYWHQLFEYENLQTIFYSVAINFLLGSLVVTFGFLLYNYQFEQSENLTSASDLKARYRNFNLQENLMN